MLKPCYRTDRKTKTMGETIWGRKTGKNGSENYTINPGATSWASEEN